MFKGKLIEDHNYYNLKSKQLSLLIIPASAIGLIGNFYNLPAGVTIVAAIVYILVMFISFRNQNKMKELANKHIEISSNQIMLKDSKGVLIETISLDRDQVVKIKENYKMAQEGMADLKEEIKGNVEKHFLVLQSDKKERRFDFEIETYYMLTQLTKVITQWKNDDYNISYV